MQRFISYRALCHDHDHGLVHDHVHDQVQLPAKFECGCVWVSELSWVRCASLREEETKEKSKHKHKDTQQASKQASERATHPPSFSP